MENEISELLKFSQTLGVLKSVNSQHITNFNLAFHPFISTKHYYQLLGHLQTLWQQLFFNISKNDQFLQKIFQPLKEKDEMIKRLLTIYQNTKNFTKNDGIAFSRSDYYNDLNGDPKLTQYNLMSIGMQSHQEQFQQAKKLTDYQNRHLYAESSTIKSFADTIQDFKNRKNLKGVFLFVASTEDSNLFDQMRFQIQLIKRNIKVIRVTFEELSQNLRKEHGQNLYYNNQLVSFVYYRIGYKMDHFKINGNEDIGWKIKEQIELSNAYSIPPIVMELVNQKRVQAQLTKPEVLRSFLSIDQATQIEKIFVKEWEFDSMSEQEYQQLIIEIKENPQQYILKPNLQGGGNNIFGHQVLTKLQSITKEECKLYILMKKINSNSSPNIIINGPNHHDVNCLYQISRYGSFSWINGQITHNTASGFLIRAKPQTSNEGGIMTGIGSIVPWKFIQE